MNRSSVLRLLWLVAIAACSSGGGSPTDPGSNSGTLIVLVSFPNGAAVSGAEVSLDPSGRSATTDAGGSARFEGLSVGVYSLQIQYQDATTVASVDFHAPFPASVTVTVDRPAGAPSVAIDWDGRDVPWGAPDLLQATVSISEFDSLVWRSLRDLYLGAPVVLGTGTTITTAALRPGSTRVEARLFVNGAVAATATVDVQVSYRDRWNMALEGHLPYPDLTVGDVWVVDGLALVARRREGGVSIVDIDGLNEIGRFTNPGMFTQDVKASGGVAYLSHEGDGYPFSVTSVSLADPSNPVQLGGIPMDESPSAHNVWIDGDLLSLAVNGTDDIHVYDVSDPANPVLLGTVAATSGRAHDVFTRDGLLFGSYIPAGGGVGELVVADVSMGAPVTIGRVTYPGAFTHSAWLSQDGATLYVADEVINSPIRIFDVSNPAAPTLIGRYRPRVGTIPHNFQVRDGQFAYLAHYKNGVEVIDVSDPAAPRLVGFFDTHPGVAADGGLSLVPAQSVFEGAWGVHWTDDGRIVVSDMNRGLFVFRYEPGS